MFLCESHHEPDGQWPNPEEYLRGYEDHCAQLYAESLASATTTWKVRDGFPERTGFDAVAYEAFLREERYPPDWIRDHMQQVCRPTFNEIQRRGFDRHRTRVELCRKVAFQLWGPAQSALEAVPVGVVAADYLNAGAHAVPGGGNIIAINFGLSLIHDYFVKRKSFGGGGTAAHYTTAQVQTLTALAKGIFGDPDNRDSLAFAAAQTLKSDASEQVESKMRMAMACLFILLHEYGHIASGHTEEARKWPDIAELPPGPRAKYCQIMRDWEYEADRFAFEVISGRLKPDGAVAPSPSMVAMTIGDVFGIMGLAYGQRSVSPLDTHPDPTSRAYRIYGVKDEKEFQEMVRKTPTVSLKNDRFFEEHLVPILHATMVDPAAKP